MHLQTLAITINQSLIGHDRYYEVGFRAGTPQQDRVCEATNAPVGISSGRTVCVSRWRGFAPTSSCGESTQNGKQAKAEYHHGGGALPFALHPPILCVSGQSLRTSVHGRYARAQKKGKVLAYRDFLSTDGMVYSV